MWVSVDVGMAVDVGVAVDVVFNLDRQNCLCARAAAFHCFNFIMMEVFLFHLFIYPDMYIWCECGCGYGCGCRCECGYGRVLIYQNGCGAVYVGMAECVYGCVGVWQCGTVCGMNECGCCSMWVWAGLGWRDCRRVSVCVGTCVSVCVWL